MDEVVLKKPAQLQELLRLAKDGLSKDLNLSPEESLSLACLGEVLMQKLGVAGKN